MVSEAARSILILLLLMAKQKTAKITFDLIGGDFCSIYGRAAAIITIAAGV